MRKLPARTKSQRRKRPTKTGSRQLLLRFLAIALLLLMGGALVQFGKAYMRRLWNDAVQSQFTVVIASDPIVIASYNTKSNDLTLVPLPDNLEINGAMGVGRWKAENIFKVGQYTHKGGKLLVASLQNALGIPIDGWVGPYAVEWLGFPNVAAMKEGKASHILLPQIASLESLFAHSTNLTLFDRWRLAIVFGTTPSQKRRILNIEKTGMLERVQLTSGELGWISTNDVLSEQIAREFIDPDIASEGIGIGIVNASKSPGLGKRVARIVENTGATVLWIKTEGNQQNRCQLHTNTVGSRTRLFGRISSIFKCEVKYENGQKDAWLELILGEGIADEFPSQ